MAKQVSAAISTTVCVTFPPDQFPGSLQKATELFSKFGDIARIDMTLGSTTGRLLVTYYDVRAAEKVLYELNEQAELFPATAHDFRAVSVAATTFAALPPTFSGFQTFGEIAGVSIAGEDVVVEFYDMRAAQQALMNIPGCRARRPQGDFVVGMPHDHATSDSPAANAAAAATAAAAAAFHSQAQGVLGGAQMRSYMESFAQADAGLGNTHVPAMPPGLGGAASHNLTEAHLAAAAALLLSDKSHQPQPMKASSAGGGGSASHSDTTATGSPGSVGEATATSQGGLISVGGPGKPVREKVCTKDLSKFDIVSEKVRNGQDPRTTVMVRNIPKACTRELFVEALNKLGLADRYIFFYMPFDKRRNVHCGFAFVNFRTPEDVLGLFEGMKTSSLQEVCGVSGLPPAVSYARLQGQDQLMKHFSLSAVMYDTDARKRPIFFAGSKGYGASKDQITDGHSDKADANRDGPWYVPSHSIKESTPAMSDSLGLAGGAFDYESASNFLLSNAVGA